MRVKPRILFVDDEKKFADAMSQVLRLRGFEVHTAYSGKVALSVFEPGKFDLVITDLSMPGMDGIELIRKIRKVHPTQRVIVVTAFPSQRSQGQAFKLGTLSYVAKPFRSSRLIEQVEEALGGEEEGLLGAVRLNSLDLIQLYSFVGKTIVLEILKGKDGETGRICFEKGQIVHAETSRNQGKDAFYEIQSWQSGIFKAELPLEDFPHTISERVDALILEGARLQDEQRPPSRDSEERK